MSGMRIIVIAENIGRRQLLVKALILQEADLTGRDCSPLCRTWSGIQKALDSGFRRNDGTLDNNKTVNNLTSPRELAHR